MWPTHAVSCRLPTLNISIVPALRAEVGGALAGRLTPGAAEADSPRSGFWRLLRWFLEWWATSEMWLARQPHFDLAVTPLEASRLASYIFTLGVEGNYAASTWGQSLLLAAAAH